MSETRVCRCCGERFPLGDSYRPNVCPRCNDAYSDGDDFRFFVIASLKFNHTGTKTARRKFNAEVRRLKGVVEDDLVPF